MYYTYILSNKTNSVVYVGVTNNLERRMFEHKNKLIEGFTSKYNVNKLVYYICSNDVQEAIAHEKRIKGWIRSKKDELVSSFNPEWKDLSKQWDSSLRSE